MAKSRLQHEWKKKHPFASAEREALLNVLRTSDLFQNRLGRLFREYGLTGSQYNVLRILRGEEKPLSVQEIAGRMIQVVPAMTGLIDRLEKQGLVARRRCTEDRRVVYIEKTNKALDVLRKLDEPLEELHQSLIGHLSRSELKEFIRLLEKARQSAMDSRAE